MTLPVRLRQATLPLEDSFPHGSLPTVDKRLQSLPHQWKNSLWLQVPISTHSATSERMAWDELPYLGALV